MEGGYPFLLAVITAPAFFPGEAAYLEGLLEAGLEKLHLRKPGASQEEMEALLEQIAPRWYSRLVLHPWAGSVERAGRTEAAGKTGRIRATGNSREQLVRLANRYGIPQIHCPLRELAQSVTGLPGQEAPGPQAAWSETGETGPGPEIAVSASLHSWSAIKETEEAGLAYVFMSPVFDSLSKPGYPANPDLWRRPAGPYPCKVIGLGGVDKDTLGTLIRGGWEGAAALGYIWEDAGKAVERYEQLKKIIASYCP